MPKKTRRQGYAYITAAIREEDVTLLERYARTMGVPVTRVIGELVHDARPVLAMNAAMDSGVDPTVALQRVVDVLDTAMQEVRRQARGYGVNKEAS